MNNKKQDEKKASSKGEAKVPKGDFDPLLVHYRNNLTGKVERVNAYRVIVDRGVSYYEWPKSSGNLYYSNREFAGRLNEKAEVVRGAGFVPYKPPKTEDQRVGELNASLAQENKKLQQELADIKKEMEIEKIHPKAGGSKESNKTQAASAKN